MNSDVFSNLPGVYKLVNLVNGKVYIGSTTKLRQRRFGHLSKLRNRKHHNSNLQNDWDRYGEENFYWKVIESISDTNRLIPREQYWLDFHKSYNREFGYNISPTAGNTTGVFPSPEVSKRRGELMRGRRHTPESYKRGGDTRRGRKNVKQMRPDRGKEISIMNTGEGNGRAIIDSEVVIKIIRLLSEGLLTARQIGNIYSISDDIVMNIKYGKAWRHVTEPLLNEYPFLQKWLKHTG